MKKILTIQDISCYGQCSITVALPILSSYGIETAILPSAILSTHTCGFKDFTVLDLTSEMPKIINHWINEGIKFDAIYTGYIGDVRQFDYVLECKDKLLVDGGLFIVDPAMADNGKLYPALNNDIVEGMKKAFNENIPYFNCLESELLPKRFVDADTPLTFFRFCTEFTIRLKEKNTKEYFSNLLYGRGDSVVIAINKDLLKVHIHTNAPEIIINKFKKFGSIVS